MALGFLNNLLFGPQKTTEANKTNTTETPAPVKEEVKPQLSAEQLQAKKEERREEGVQLAAPVLSSEHLALKDNLVSEIMKTLETKVPDIVSAALEKQSSEAATELKTESKGPEISGDSKVSETKVAEDQPAAQLLKLLQNLVLNSLLRQLLVVKQHLLILLQPFKMHLRE